MPQQAGRVCRQGAPDPPVVLLSLSYDARARNGSRWRLEVVHKWRLSGTCFAVWRY
jgi:hypothetical protein